jgi:hypothetical protein
VTDDGTLQDLLAERAIHRVLLQYCRGIDRMDADLVRSSYHPDAVDDHGSFRGTVDEFVVWVWRLLDRYSMTMHFLGNSLVDVHPERPDVAHAETYGMAFHRSDDPDPGRNLVIGFRYLDRFENRPTGGWRIARRLCTTEWVQRDDPDRRWPIPDGILQGSRNPSDPVYRPWD